MIKLLVMDLDGTVLAKNHLPTDENIKAVKYAMDKGVVVTLNSGRGYLGGLHQYAQSLQLSDVPLVCSNGAEIRQFSDGSHLFKTLLEESTVNTLKKIAADFGYGINYYCDDDALYYTRHNYCLDYFQTINKGFERQLSMIQGTPNDNVGMYKMELITEKDDKFAESMDRLSALSKVNMFSGRKRIEIGNALSDKGQGLIRLCRILGIGPEHTMVIGDGNNDVALLKTAGVAVAMGQAVDGCKEVAHFVTDTADNSGVAKAIYKFI